jgi:hypothetical protein
MDTFPLAGHKETVHISNPLYAQAMQSLPHLKTIRGRMNPLVVGEVCPWLRVSDGG